MLSKILNLIFATGAIAILIAVVVFLPYHYRWISIFVIPCIVLLSLSYVFGPEINWWWYKKYPPELPSAMSMMLLQYFPFYKNLSAENKKRFRSRTKMYTEGRGFYGKLGGDNQAVPMDIKTIISANAVMMTFGKKDFILDPFERVFIYLQAFPSPQFPKHLHACEIEEEDSVFIFSAEHIRYSFQQPKNYYNIVLHEMSKVFRIVHKQHEYPIFDERVWSGFDKEAILRFTGLPDVEAFPVSVNFFFNYPEKFKASMPEMYEKYKTIFNLNPINTSDPVIDKTVVSKVV